MIRVLCLLIRELLTANLYPNRNIPSQLTVSEGRFFWQRRDFLMLLFNKWAIN